MTRFAIDRKNRDRKGGHKNTPLVGDKEMMSMALNRPNENFYTSNIVRAVIKRESKKAMRRQHNKAINEGLALMNQEQEDRIAAYWDGEEYLDLSAQYDLDWMNEYGDPEPYDDYSEYDHWNDDDFDHDHHSFSPFDDDWDYRDYRPRPHASFLDQTTTQQLASEVQRGMVSLDLEIIENRDAGKTLGQLLRERLSRPF